MKWLLFVTVIPVLAGCASVSMKPETGLADYNQALRELQTRPTVAPGSAAEREAIDRFKAFFADITETSVRAKVRTTYTDDTFFNDTLKTVRGNAALEEYFLETAKNTRHVRAEVQDVAVSDGNYYIRWEMDVEFAMFRRGKPVRTIGITHVRFAEDGRIALHQDFWDSAAGFYEHVPVLGSGIRLIKCRL